MMLIKLSTILSLCSLPIFIFLVVRGAGLTLVLALINVNSASALLRETKIEKTRCYKKGAQGAPA